MNYVHTVQGYINARQQQASKHAAFKSPTAQFCNQQPASKKPYWRPHGVCMWLARIATAASWGHAVLAVASTTGHPVSLWFGVSRNKGPALEMIDGNISTVSRNSFESDSVGSITISESGEQDKTPFIQRKLHI